LPVSNFDRGWRRARYDCGAASLKRKISWRSGDGGAAFAQPPDWTLAIFQDTFLA
jgi:hypothetical protein